MDNINIGATRIGSSEPTFIVAEISANHHQDLGEAKRLIEAAARAGVDAVKLQTYTPDTITLESDKEWFRRNDSDGYATLHELYKKAYTPWEWHKELKAIAVSLGVEFFSSPFDPTAVEFLEGLGVPCYKIASFEIVDIPLLRKVARTMKPVIISTGMATEAEITTAVEVVKAEGNDRIVLLRCNSGYPALPEEMDLKSIPDMMEKWQVPVGLSDHTLGPDAAVASVVLGACMIEKHFTLSRKAGGPDSGFSMEPADLKKMVSSIRTVEKALGSVRYGPSLKEKAKRRLRRSLFVVVDVNKGDVVTPENVRSIRPSDGLPPIHQDDVIGRSFRTRIKRGTPLEWSHLE